MELVSPRTWASPTQPSHTNSKVWVSPLEKIQDRWLVIKDNLSRVRFDRSPFVPQDRPGYFEHLASQAEDLAKKEKKRLQQLESVGGGHHFWIIPFDGQSFSDNRSAVLAVSSIWSLWYDPPQGRPEAPWPTPDEFREEGDERHTSGFGRFLPLPRVPGNETVAWKQKAFLEPYHLDQVNPVFWREDTPRFREEEGRTLAETLMTELGEGNSDGGMRREADVFDPTISRTNSATDDCASMSARTQNSQSEHQTESPLYQGIDGKHSPSPEHISSIQHGEATPDFNPASEFFPCAAGITKRQMISQLSPETRSYLTTTGIFSGEDEIDGEELLCEEKANEALSLQTRRVWSRMEPRGRVSVFDV
ncbi:hypothetical protein MMC26_002819 [Xylographa opegraphella]|nr:hypothetical protein [Xylographa opegraphella]